jgi:hypothetical protein
MAPITYPDWVPAAVVRAADQLLSDIAHGYTEFNAAWDAQVRRLTLAPEMEGVWRQLLRCPANLHLSPERAPLFAERVERETGMPAFWNAAPMARA